MLPLVYRRGPRAGELRFQLVHQGRQLVHFGHYPALFDKRQDGDDSRSPQCIRPSFMHDAVSNVQTQQDRKWRLARRIAAP